MPKILLYMTAKIVWIFTLYGTDINENRAHVHVGRKGIDNYCKIWLEPNISVADAGDLTPAQVRQIVQITGDMQNKLLEQWKRFKQGKQIKMITIKR